MGGLIPDVSQSSTSTSSFVQVGTLPKFVDQWRSITSNRIVLVNGHHLQLRCRQFVIKATPAHHSIIEEEVDELLAKGATKPSTWGAGFYSKIFVKQLVHSLEQNIGCWKTSFHPANSWTSTGLRKN